MLPNDCNSPCVCGWMPFPVQQQSAWIRQRVRTNEARITTLTPAKWPSHPHATQVKPELAKKTATSWWQIFYPVRDGIDSVCVSGWKVAHTIKESFRKRARILLLNFYHHGGQNFPIPKTTTKFTSSGPQPVETIELLECHLRQSAYIWYSVTHRTTRAHFQAHPSEESSWQRFRRSWGIWLMGQSFLHFQSHHVELLFEFVWVENRSLYLSWI